MVTWHKLMNSIHVSKWRFFFVVRKKAMEALSHGLIKYRRYTIEEIEVATDHFNSLLKIGEGGYGHVYKG
jgi:hypothetical protein